MTWFVIGLALFYMFSTFVNEYLTNFRVAQLKKRVDALYKGAHTHPDPMTKDEIETMVTKHFAELGEQLRRQRG
jgi:hypothetical protein